ncbi:partial H+-transporting ATPase, partial [Methylacidimicrobium cyclopophantes]
MKPKEFRFADPRLLALSFRGALCKASPLVLWRNPVIFVTEIGALVSTIEIFASPEPKFFTVQISLWLWFTVLFSTFAEAMAESRGKAQADSLRLARTITTARRLREGREEAVSATELRKGDLVICVAGDMIPADGEVIEGAATVDESAVTGESAPVVRESGGDRSAVTGGTKVISDRIVVRVTSDPGQTFLDRMIQLVEGAKRQKTPNEIALGILLAALTFLFLLVILTLVPFLQYLHAPVSIATLAALMVCLIPTTIGGLLSAIGIAGIDRLVQHNVMATSGRAVEAAGDIDVLLLDKTGTITLGNRMATEFVPAAGIDPLRLVDAAQLASLADETPEGRSIVVLAKQQHGLRGREVLENQAHFVPFSAQTRMSGVDFPESDGNPARSIRKGAEDAIEAYLRKQGGSLPESVRQAVERIARDGGTPLVVAEGKEALGVIHLKDVVKGGIKQRFARLRQMGIRTIMITGDNPQTAAAIAMEAG